MRVWGALNEVCFLDAGDRIRGLSAVISEHLEELLYWVLKELGPGYGAVAAEATLEAFAEKDLAGMMRTFSPQRGNLSTYFKVRLGWRCNWYREHYKPTTSVDLAHEFPTRATMEERINTKELRQMVQNLLEQLSSGDSIILNLFYLKGYSLEQVAEALRSNTGAVKVRLHRARHRALEHLRKQGFEDFADIAGAFYV